MENSSRPIALTIAGFDPSSGAGVTADLKTFAAHNIYGVACISALTVQSTQGVRRVEVVRPELIRQTLDCLAGDVSLAGIKIGMLGSGEVVTAVSAFLAAQPSALRPRIVLDPILRSTSGAPLLDLEGVRLLREKLLPQVGWVTPNLDELAILTGTKLPLTDLPIPEAADQLQSQVAGGLNVVVTGGHLNRPDDFLLTAAGEPDWFRGERVLTSATHGTGCAFSSALACELISGQISPGCCGFGEGIRGGCSSFGLSDWQRERADEPFVSFVLTKSSIRTPIWQSADDEARSRTAGRGESLLRLLQNECKVENFIWESHDVLCLKLCASAFVVRLCNKLSFLRQVSRTGDAASARSWENGACERYSLSRPWG